MVAGCQAHYTDLSNRQQSDSISPTKSGYYFLPTWVSNSMIIFEYKASFSLVTLPQFLFYNVEEGTWGEIPLAPSENCSQFDAGSLQRLPDHNLGFVRNCNNLSTDNVFTIQEMDITTGKTTTLADSGPLHVPGGFAFSTNMSELVQADMADPLLSTKLFYRQGNTWTQIVPNFTRSMNPSWSPFKRKIVFWGTQNYLGGNPNDFKTLPEILGLSTATWDLYISTPDGLDPKKIVSSVQDPWTTKWSPKEDIVAFSGTFENLPGIWLIDPATLQATRIWPTASNFDWSPDGSKMIILDQKLDLSDKILSQKFDIVSLSY
jgi:hypothetical protein